MDSHTDLYNQILKQADKISPEVVKNVLQHFIPQVALPQTKLHQMTHQQLRLLHGTAISFTLMIQDITQPEYYLAGAIKQNAKINDNQSLKTNLIINKYWNSLKDVQILEEDQYEHIILERQIYHAAPVKGETYWVQKSKQDRGQINSVILKTYDQNNLKLGQVVYGIGLVEFQSSNKTQMEFEFDQDDIKDINYFYPPQKVPRIHLIRLLNPLQIQQSGLDVVSKYLKKQVNFPQQKKNMLKIFQNFASQKYSQYLLYSLIADSPNNLYISGEDLQDFLKDFLPYLVKIDLKLPLKAPLFPYKKEILIETPLQLSNLNTFVIINFTNLGQGKIEGQAIQTLSFLKKFVQEGEAIYKWEYGESFLKHNTSGFVVKGSSIISPQFILKEKVDLGSVPQLSFYQQNLQNLRAYILQVKNRIKQINLSEQEKSKIEEDFVTQRKTTQGKLTGQVFNRRLILSKLQAASSGQKVITLQTYQKVKQIVDF